MLSLKVNIKNTADFHKIQELADQAAATILVGFLSGVEHVETKHKNEKGEYKDLDGQDPEFNPIEVSELAKMLHFGTDTIPARPFLTEGLESKEKELKESLRDQAQKVFNGGKANWNKVGTQAVGAIDEFVRSDYYKSMVPNSPKTIKYKGSDTPLIDGGNMIQSLHFIVEAQ